MGAQVRCVTNLAFPLLLALTACTQNGESRRPTPTGRRTATAAEQAAVDALVSGNFDAARRAADEVLTGDPDAARAAAVRAVARYRAAGVALFTRVEALEEAFE